MKKSSRILGGLLTVGVLTLGASGIAQACGGPGGFHHGKGMAMGMQRMDYMMEKLDLNDAQRESIRKLVDQQRDQMRNQRDSMRDIRKALRQQVMSENYDAAKVRELADSKARLMANMLVQRTETMHQIRQQLTPEQMTRLNRMLEHKMGPGRF